MEEPAKRLAKQLRADPSRHDATRREKYTTARQEDKKMVDQLFI
jgi:hypothetical protein